MDKVLFYKQSMDPRMIRPNLPNHELIPVSTREALAEAVLTEERLFCVLIEWNRPDMELRHFLESLKRSFPILKIGLISKPQEGQAPDDSSAGGAPSKGVSSEETPRKDEPPNGYYQIDSTLEQERLGREIREFIASITTTNRREKHRFQWPLEGYLSLDQEQWSPYRIRSLSASGAFLECQATAPEPGSVALLRVIFRDFKMLASCEILDARRASSNLPSGFGVSFLDLSPQSAGMLDRIIHDALVRTLLEPQAEPEIPSIGGEELLTDSFELL